VEISVYLFLTGLLLIIWSTCSDKQAEACEFDIFLIPPNLNNWDESPQYLVQESANFWRIFEIIRLNMYFKSFKFVSLFVEVFFHERDISNSKFNLKIFL